MILTDDEVVIVTKRSRRSAQARMLRAMGIEHKERPGECPAVLRAHVEHLLGSKTPATVERSLEPDWDAVT